MNNYSTEVDDILKMKDANEIYHTAKKIQKLRKKLIGVNRLKLAQKLQSHLCKASIAKSIEILGGKQVNEKEKISLAKYLKKNNEFRYARKLFAQIRENRHNDLHLAHQQAICTYKDPDLPSKKKFNKALTILGTVSDFDNTKNQETLGLLGAIYKRKWEFSNQIKDLEFSYEYYYRGYKQWEYLLEKGEKGDDGYTAINAAFVADLLSYAIKSTNRNINAQEIRMKIVKVLKNQTDSEKNQYWREVTLAEAYLGLGNYKEAKLILDRVKEIEDVDPWEYDSTTRQLCTLADLHINRLNMGFNINEKDSDEDIRKKKEKAILEVQKVLNGFLGDKEGVDTAFKGKLGLALSGGGFRASLFHIGVLARLAEMDELKDIEVLSCVSGGSIIGSYYYLKIVKELETKKDDNIDKQTYIDIIKEIERDFLAIVQKNLRVRLFSNIYENFKIIFNIKSRTHRMAELYEKYIYKDVWEEILKQRGENCSKKESEDNNLPIPMYKLKIEPVLESVEHPFNYKNDNWKRKNKVPNLIINATTLNTGHNWQFTASWMGESPENLIPDIDTKFRLRRMYYEQSPKAFQNLSLGKAVAASAGVPGIFDSLKLNGLYPDIEVQLVDGGVHDNQGTKSLLEQDCKNIIISDASGQINSYSSNEESVLNILSRSSNVSQERIRESQYSDLMARESTGLIKKLFFVHLRSCFDLSFIV